LLTNAPAHPTEVAFFSECYEPIINGVVASIDGLRAGLADADIGVTIVTPHFPHERTDDRAIARLPSLPLPTSTGYRLCIPYLSAATRARVRAASVVHVHSPFVTGWMGLRYARRYGMPLVYTYHTQLEAYAHYVPFEPNATRFAASQLTRTFANLTDAVIVPTPAMATHLRDLGVAVRLEVVPSGIDLRAFGAGRRDEALRAGVGAAPEDRMLLCVSRLAKEKNVELLLEAVALAGDPRMRVVVAGDGPARAELEARARECGVAGQTRFLGFVPRDRLPDLYASCDAFCMPSTTETQGLVQAEALAAGAYVLAADAPQNREVLGGAGRVLPATPRAFATALLALSQPADPAISEVAREAAKRFSVDIQLDRTIALYRDLQNPSERGLTANIRSQ
jgi:1,2-diacylglycerol 3-alpha-glucosyltransferase